MEINEFVPLRITLKCPLDCKFCISHDPEGKHVPVNSVLNTINTWPDMANRSILIHGGDPMFHPDLLRIVRAAGAKGKVSLCLSGIGFSEEKALQVMPYVRSFRVMVPALNPSLYKRITKGQLSEMIHGLKKLIDLHAHIEVWIPVQPDNLGHVKSLIDSLSGRLPSLDGIYLSFHEIPRLSRHLDELWNLFEYLAEKDLPWPVKLDRQTLPPPCTAPSEAIFLKAEHLFEGYLNNTTGINEQKKCKDCAIKQFCPSNISGGPWMGLAVTHPLPLAKDAKQIPCTIPWTNLDISENNGNAIPCCKDWVKPPGYSVYEHGIMEVWNSDSVKQIRRAVAENRRKDTCKSICPYMHSDSASIDHLFSKFYPGLHTLRAIAEGRIEMDTPPASIAIGVTPFCNLRCVMCRVDNRHIRKELPDSVYDELYTLIPRMKNITFTGGEPLLSVKLLAFLKKLKEIPPHKSNTQITIVTNGTVLTLARFQQIYLPALRNIVISLNAANKQTYERINRGGKWEEIINNIKEVSAFIEERHLPVNLVLSFVILRSNLDQMQGFVRIARTVNAQVRFLVNTNDPGRGVVSPSKENGNGPLMRDPSVREWFIGDQDLCDKAIKGLKLAIREMEGMAGTRILDAIAVLRSLEQLCGKGC